MNGPGVQVAPRDNPYFGLEYYDERFGAWFFGREAEGGKIITNLRAARLTLLHAESGVGKSSLLRAGVAWRIRKIADDMSARNRPVRSIPVVFTSWKDDPCRELTDCVGEAVKPYLADRPLPVLPADRLDLAIEAASGAVNANLLIMLDQFEEYFLYRSREPVPERFADELARCINRTDLRANFLIAIREDAYAGLGDLFKGRIPNVYGNYLHIDYLDRASAEQAIREPLGVYNSQRDTSEQVRLQDDLVEAVLEEVRAFGGDADARPGQPAAANGNGNIRIATPLLQLVMERVWNAEQAEGSHELRLATLQKLHGVRMIVDAHLTKALDSLSSAERKTAIDMFDHLVTPSGGKIAESVSDLARRTSHSEEQVSSVLAKLDHERIVRPIPAAPGQDPMRFRRYEIFHDVLAPTINRAIAAREEQRRVRRIRRFAAGVGALLVIVSLVAASFLYLLISANNEKLKAESRQLAAEAYLNVTTNPELSTQLALQALSLRHTTQAEDALRAALPRLQTVRTFQAGTTVLSAAFDPVDADKLVSGDFSGYASIWDVRTGQRLVRISLGGYTTTGGAGSPAFNPSGTEVAVGFGNGTVAVFDARTGKKLQSATDGSAPIDKVAFLGNTGTVVIGSQSNLALWQPQNGSKCCDVLAREPVYALATSPRDPHEFAVTSAGSTAVLWNVKDPRKPQKVTIGTASAVTFANDIKFSADGSRVVTAESDGTVDVYDLARPAVAATRLTAAQADAWSTAFSPDGKQVAVGYSNGTTLVWNLSTKLPLTLLAGNAGGVMTTQFSQDGSKIVTASQDGTIRVWYAEPRELRTQFTISPNGGKPSPVGGAEYIGNRIITLDQYGHLYVFTAGGEQQAVVSPGVPVNAVTWNNSGTKIVTSGTDGTAALWQASGSSYTKVSLPSPVHVGGADYVAMSPDGSRFAAETGDFTAQVLSTANGHVLRRLNFDNQIQVLAISPDNHQVIGGDLYGQVEMWNGTATNPWKLGSLGPPIDDVQYNQSGSKFVTSSESGIVGVWDARDGRLLRSIDACPSPRAATFSPDGSMIAVACGDGAVRVFDTASGQTLTVLQGTNAGIVADLAFSPDGKSIVAAIDAGDTGGVEVWNTELATPSLTALEQLARQRVPQKLTAAQQQQYLNGG